MRHRYSFTLLAFALPISSVLASTGVTPGRSSPQEAFASWQRDHGSSWRVAIEPHTGYGRFLYGGSAPAAARPKSDADFTALARSAIRATREIHGIEDATLVDDEVVFLPLGRVGSTDKMTVRFRQMVDGVPVVRGFAAALFAMDGRLLSIDSTAVPEISHLASAPVLSAEDAARAAARFFDTDTGLSPTSVSDPEIVIDPIVRRDLLVPVLAWRVDVQAALLDSDAEGFTYFVDARDGSQVDRRSSVHHFDVSGNVKANVSPGVLPDIASNPPAPENMRYLTVTSNAGDVQTDAVGNFNIPGASPPVSITVQFSGQFADVLNAAGGRHVVNAVALQSSGNAILMNDQSLPTVTAEGNAYNWINRLRDFVRSVNPTDDHADFLASANVNLPAPCNAFYDGLAVNFFVQSTCVNSAYSTVVVHEMGHWLNDQYGSGNGSDGFGEGNADVYAMYIVDDPIVGRNFEGNGYIRNGENPRQFCGDCCGGCYGEVHNDGEVLMGALWKVRRRLKTTHGATLGGEIADSLFFAWMNAYDDGQIRSIIETHWLTLDDDNGNLNDGTPHYQDIDPAFLEQGFPGFPVDPCTPPSSYCIGATNSTGFGASIGFSGSQSMSANDLHFLVSGCPANKLGYFIWGEAQVQVPLGNGFRCVGANVRRFHAFHTDASGEGAFQPNVDALPGGEVLDPGETKYVQFYYRDPPAGGASFNLSDGLSLEICP